jgi:hypothetical protein
MNLRLTPALAAALAAAYLAPAPSAAATPRCAKPGYSYGGLLATEPAHGVVASITVLSTPTVESGHVAAWVGVAGEGLGATAEWLQVGLNTLPGTGNRLYYEYALPGEPVRYVELAANVSEGRAVRVAVLQARGGRAWRVWVDGRSASDPIVLSPYDRLRVIAATESWDGGLEGCNRLVYRFAGLALATIAGGVWRPFGRTELLEDQGYRVVRGTASLTVSLGA